VGALVGWGTAGVANAGVTTFTMSPGSGTPGTVVHVSGTGCTPGLLASAGTDFVAITATTLDLAFRAPVAADGSWQSSFTVPPTTLGAGALVTAVCVSSSVRSLLTIYTPQMFTITHVVTPPTVTPAQPSTVAPHPPANGSAPGSTVSDHPGAGDGSGAPSLTLGPGISTTLPLVGAIPGAVAIPAGRDGGSKADPKVYALDQTHTTTARPDAKAATLAPADLGASLAADHGAAGGLGWLGWLLVAVLALAVIGAPTWLWRSRRPGAVPIPADDVG
jgi:hypothetical protein